MRNYTELWLLATEDAFMKVVMQIVDWYVFMQNTSRKTQSKKQKQKDESRRL